MKTYLHKVQKLICAFFIIIGCFLIIEPTSVTAASSPTQAFTATGGKKYDSESGGYAQFAFHFVLQSYDRYAGTAVYSVTSSFCLNKKMTVYTDVLYINGDEVGSFSSKNGKQNAGCYTREGEGFSVTFKEGYNDFETKGTDGVGGDSFGDIFIDKFSLNKVTFKDWNGTILKTEDIEDGSCAVPPSNPSRDGYIFTGWDKGYCDITSNTTITAQYKNINYNIGYAGNGATSGGTSSQTCTVLYDCSLNSNGFRREFSVGFNGNGGSSAQASSTTNASFLGWMDHNNFNYKGAVYPYWTFNAPFYANYNTDVRNYAGYNKRALIDHWLSSSVDNAYENRQSSEFFNIGHYMDYGGSDLNDAFGSDRASYVNHFTYDGHNEVRSATAPISGQYDTYPDRATVRDLSLNDGANLTLTAKWQDGSVILPSATRPGYKLIGWYTSSAGGDKVGDAGEKYTPTGNSTIYAKWDKAPSITASDQTFYEGQYKADYWQSTQRYKNVSASDQEDGNITSKVKVIEDTTNVNVPGTYKVTYQVTDSVGQTVSKTVKITVLYNNPPTIDANDRWFYLDEDVTTARLLEKTHAQDIEDGDITPKITVKSSNVVQEVGIYDVTFTVTDAFGKTATKDIKVHIVDFTHHVDNYYIRYISKEFLYTLDYGSRWRNDPILSAELKETLNKEPSDENALYIIEWNDEINYQMKDFFKTVPMDKDKNQKFIDQFGDIFKKQP